MSFLLDSTLAPKFEARVECWKFGARLNSSLDSTLAMTYTYLLDFWGPAEMRGNDFEENKVIPLIFKQFWSRSHVSKLDRLTPQDVYHVHCTYHNEREYCECIFGRARVGTISFIFYAQLLITDYHCTDDNKCIQFNEHSDADLRQLGAWRQFILISKVSFTHCCTSN